MRCIFCLKEHPPSEEHVFPEAIGGVLVIDRVCRTCNSFLGTEVDAPLSDSPSLVMRRFELKLAGKKGNVPDPLRKIFGTGVLGGDPTQKIKARVDPTTGKPDIELIYNKTELEGGTIKISIDKRRIAELPKIIQKTRTDAGLPPLEENELKRVVENSQTIHTIENPDVLYTINLPDFRRGIFKIAYERAFKWLGEDYLSDPMAAKLRDVVLGKENMEITRSIIDQNADNVLFAAVVVSEMKHRYIKGQQDHQRVRFLYNDPINKNLRESSLIDEYGRITAAMLVTTSNH